MKNRTAHRGDKGIRIRASVKTTNARPGPCATCDQREIAGGGGGSNYPTKMTTSKSGFTNAQQGSLRKCTSQCFLGGFCDDSGTRDLHYKVP